MTYNVLMGTLNPTHSLTYWLALSEIDQWQWRMATPGSV